jgi:hypothetical protein
MTAQCHPTATNALPMAGNWWRQSTLSHCAWTSVTLGRRLHVVEIHAGINFASVATESTQVSALSCLGKGARVVLDSCQCISSGTGLKG